MTVRLRTCLMFEIKVIHTKFSSFGEDSFLFFINYQIYSSWRLCEVWISRRCSYDSLSLGRN